MPSNQDCYNGLINDFREKCHEWQEREIDAVFNKELCGKNIDEVKYIVVADNPGENEKKYSTYLYEGDEGNRSGRIARQIFSLIFIPLVVFFLMYMHNISKLEIHIFDIYA